MADTNSGSGGLTKGSAKDITQRARAQVAKMGQQATEFAARAFNAERTTEKVSKALKQSELDKAELQALAQAQLDQVLARTAPTHRAATDMAGMALAVGIDLAAFEGMAALGARYDKVAKYQPYLAGAPHLLVGVTGYGAALLHRSKVGGFPSMAAEAGEEAAKHLIVLGVSTYAKEALLAPAAPASTRK